MKMKARMLESTCVVDLAGRNVNLASALARGLPTVQQLPERTDRLAIVASGPSVRYHLDELRDWNGEIWAINGAYGYLIDHGIVPHGFFGMDPLPGLAPYVAKADRRTTFYIASICDPAVLNALAGHDVMLWNPAGEDMNYPDDQWIIGGGTTAVTRAPYLGLLRGFRDITLYGVDSSFEGEHVYCYPWGTYAEDISTERSWVEANGEGPFLTELGLMKQVSQLNILHQRFNERDGVSLTFRCNGLLAAFMRAPMIDDSVFEVEKDDEAA